jgi:hypothetical protein
VPTAYVAAFIALSTAIHLALFKLFPRIPAAVAVLLGATLSVLGYQLMVHLGQGVLDPFFGIAAAVQFGLSLFIGTVVAVVLRIKQRPTE